MNEYADLYIAAHHQDKLESNGKFGMKITQIWCWNSK